MMYTSPLTGVTYTVRYDDSYGWERYTITDPSGREVQFALRPEGVPASVAHYEAPGPDISSPRD